MTLSLLTLFLLVLVAVAGGLLAGLFGIGGGIVLIPMFLAVFRLSGFAAESVVHLAFGTSLAIIIPTALSSALGHRKRNNVAWEHVLRMTGGSLVGVAIGSSLATGLDGTMLKACFGIMQVVTGAHMLTTRPPRLVDGEAAVTPGWGPLLLTGLTIGLFSSFFGVGGGVIAVPLMTLLLRQPLLRAVGTSSGLMVISACAGTASYIYHGWGAPNLPPLSIGYVNLGVFALVAPISMLAARLGVRLANRLSRDRLYAGFAWFIISVGIYMVSGLLR